MTTHARPPACSITVKHTHTYTQAPAHPRTNTHAQTNTYAPIRTHTHAHTRTHTRTHARAHTHTHRTISVHLTVEYSLGIGRRLNHLTIYRNTLRYIYLVTCHKTCTRTYSTVCCQRNHLERTHVVIR